MPTERDIWREIDQKQNQCLELYFVQTYVDYFVTEKESFLNNLKSVRFLLMFQIGTSNVPKRNLSNRLRTIFRFFFLILKSSRLQELFKETVSINIMWKSSYDSLHAELDHVIYHMLRNLTRFQCHGRTHGKWRHLMELKYLELMIGQIRSDRRIDICITTCIWNAGFKGVISML